jgi:large subunit ribosomal protein L28
MAKCGICGKGVSFGIKLSHSHRRTNRSFKPNVQKVKAVVDGTPCRVHACTRCLRSGKVERAARVFKQADSTMETQIGLQEIASESISSENASL